MERSRVTELHYITTFDNLESIMERGILSRHRAAKLPHTSIADEEVQDRRVGKRVPNGLLLHDYANTYFDARNAMMFRRRQQRSDIIVLRVHHGVLDLPSVVISDGNAASDRTAFYASPAGLTMLDETRVYARYWTHDDTWEYWERKRQRQAEVLAPQRVPVEFIVGCCVRERGMRSPCRAVGPDLDVRVDKRVFFDD